jgi:hypothetical protein
MLGCVVQGPLGAGFSTFLEENRGILGSFRLLSRVFRAILGGTKWKKVVKKFQNRLNPLRSYGKSAHGTSLRSGSF